jgi:hypothetical protein
MINMRAYIAYCISIRYHKMFPYMHDSVTIYFAPDGHLGLRASTCSRRQGTAWGRLADGKHAYSEFRATIRH